MRKTILDTIVDRTREDVQARKRLVNQRDFDTFSEYHRPRRDFCAALARPAGVSVIAEIKKASPSKGVIRQDFHPAAIAQSYQQHGAAAISVLTDGPFFQGSLGYLQEVSSVSGIPVLRKDFIIDPYQVAEARAWGADAILLIVRVLEDVQMRELLAVAAEEGLQVLVECYGREDWDRVDFDLVSIVGVNNRDLGTFKVDLHRGTALLAEAPEGVMRVSESGISTPEDIAYLGRNGIHSALVGEHLMRAVDPGRALEELIGAKESSNGLP
jgi:indole-3-glycerol phosphate synthase